MSKKNNKRGHYQGDKNIIEEDLGIICTEAMQVYYANTNLMRQISNLVDGLKPVQRRILTSMHEHNLTERSRIKSASIVAKTMEVYHPHGDSSIYGALSKMAQWWAFRYKLIKPLSNFGSQFGGSPAAQRYTDITLTRFAIDAYFTEFDLDNVPTKYNYDRTKLEPEYLPSKYPMALFLGCFGIGQGIQVGIPPFRPDQVFDKTIAVLDNPKYDDALMMPDSTTYCDIIDLGDFEEICRTGRGKIRYQSTVDLDKTRNEILIRTLPPQVSMKDVSDAIIELHEQGKIKGYIDSFDEPDLSPCKEDGAAGLRVKFKREIDLDEVLPVMMRYAGLTKTLGVNFVYLDNYREVSYGVLDYLREWIEYRREFKQITYSKKLIKTNERIHSLETILMIFNGKNAEKALKIARTSNRNELVDYLMKEFKVSSLQARSISNMSISAFTPDSIARYHQEKLDLEELSKEYMKILANPKKIDKIIKKELQEGKEKYGSDIRSKIILEDGGDGTPNTSHLLVLTKEGLVKKLPHDAENIGFIAEGDSPVELTYIDNRDDLMIFASSGKVYKLPVSKIPSTMMAESGSPVSDYLKIKGDIIRILPKPSKKVQIVPDTNFVVMVTEEGLIKKTDMVNYQNMRSELNGMTVDKNDKVVDVKLMMGHAEILVYTESGMGVRYTTEDIRETGRISKGIIGIVKDDFDKVKGFDIISPKDNYILCVTNKGKAKKCDMESFKSMKRTAKVLRIITLDPDEEISLIQTIKGKEEVVFFMKSGVIRKDAREVTTTSRIAKATKIIPVKRGDNIIDVRLG